MTDQDIKYLFDRGMFGMKMGLSNITDLLKYNSVDHSAMHFVHIAGTNGKGSVANIISAVLTANGYRTGLFTSPHLQRFNERIKIDGKEIADEEISSLVRFFKDGIEKFNCTFFEANTAMAIKYFSDNEVDISIIETGLGGRLDSTNVITPVLSVITGVDLDHQKQLGSSIIEIAREKAGIIKKGVPVVLNTDKSSVYKKISSAARKKKSKLVNINGRRSPCRFKKQKDRLLMSFFSGGEKCSAVIRLKGDYQKKNLMTSVAALKILNSRFPIRSAPTKIALENLRVKGRMEKISDNPLIIIDAAHNVQGLRVLSSEIRKIKDRRVHLIAGTVKDKDYERILKIISDIDAELYFVQASNGRMLESCKASKMIRDKFRKECTCFETSEEVLGHVLKNMGKNDVMIVSGSHFLLGEFLDEFEKIKPNINKIRENYGRPSENGSQNP